MRSRLACFAMCLVFAFSIAAGAEPSIVLKATDGDPKLLHNVDDYLAGLSEAELPPEKRAALFANASENTTRDWIGEHGDVYGMSYTFKTPGLGVQALLHVLRDEKSSASVAEQLLLGVKKGAEKSGPSVTPISGLEDWHPGSHYLTFDGEKGPIGNIFIVVQGAHVYMLVVAGAGGYNNAATVRAFLEPKLDRILIFVPESATGQARVESPDDGVSSARGAANAGMFAFDVVGFALLYGLALLVNNIGGRRILSPGWMGVLGLAIVTCIWSAMFWHVAREIQQSGRELTPFQQGQMIGQVAAPALFVLIVFAIVRGIRRASTRASSDVEQQPRG